MSLTNLRPMLMQVTTDPAMLRYLDLATSTGQSPNENYSRELMELFTMGPDNYTETDVRESAKALAGWQVPQPDSSATFTVAAGVTRNLPVYATQRPGVFNARRAFKGSVSYPARRVHSTHKASSTASSPSLLPPCSSPRRSRSILSPRSRTPALSTKLADAFRRSDYGMKTLMRSVFMSPEFSSAQSYRTLATGPADFMVHAARALGANNLSKLIATAGSGMGQSLFDPPDVSGWPNNEAWISSNTVVERVNFVTAALGQVKTALPSAADAPRQQLDGVLSSQTASLLNQAADDRARWFITLASPEFQLK